MHISSFIREPKLQGKRSCSCLGHFSVASFLLYICVLKTLFQTTHLLFSIVHYFHTLNQVLIKKNTSLLKMIILGLRTDFKGLLLSSGLKTLYMYIWNPRKPQRVPRIPSAVVLELCLSQLKHKRTCSLSITDLYGFFVLAHNGHFVYISKITKFLFFFFLVTLGSVMYIGNIKYLHFCRCFLTNDIYIIGTCYLY